MHTNAAVQVWTGAESWQLAVELRVPVADCARIVLKHYTHDLGLIQVANWSFPVATYVELGQDHTGCLDLIKISTLCSAARLTDYSSAVHCFTLIAKLQHMRYPKFVKTFCLTSSTLEVDS